MPFTVSHAAAVLPLRRTPLVWSALVIGSFGPDFEYFLRISSDSRSWHYYPDVLLYCLPFTLILFFVFQTVLKRPLAALLPNSVQRRISAEASLPRTTTETLLLILSLLIGIVSHMIWDACTHPHTWATNSMHFMWKAMAIYGHRMYVYQFLQSLSSVVGLLILGIYFLIWYGRAPETGELAIKRSPTHKVVVVFGIVLSSFFSGAWFTLRTVGRPSSFLHTSSFDVLFVVSVLSFFLWELLAYSLIALAFEKRKGAPGEEPLNNH